MNSSIMTVVCLLALTATPGAAYAEGNRVLAQLTPETALYFGLDYEMIVQDTIHSKEESIFISVDENNELNLSIFDEHVFAEMRADGMR